MAVWYYEHYRAWLDSGCPANDVVQKLCIDNSRLTSLPSEIGRLQNLTELNVCNNQLTSIPPEIGQLQNLTCLWLNMNELTSIPLQICGLQKLRELYLFKNKLTSIPPEIGRLENLAFLWLSSNEITSIPSEIGQLHNLTNLLIYQNKLTSIPPEIGQLHNLEVLEVQTNNLLSIPPEIGQLQNLIQLWVHNNNLTSIPPEIGQLQNLSGLLFNNNQITTIPPEVGQLHNLKYIKIDNNPIDHIPLNVQRLLNRQRLIAPGVYGDNQSVHNSSIQQTLKRSILSLLREKMTEKDIIPLILLDPVLSPFTKESLIEYSKDETVHSELNLSFSDILLLVWNRILISPHASEIKAVLNTEMKDAECMCFTGRISRLVNCLNGFDQLVSIRISDNEQIGNVIAMIKAKLEEKNEYTVEKHKEKARIELKDLQVEEREIEIWLSHIEE